MSHQGTTSERIRALIGRVVNGHEIVRVLGEGGMGVVYVARHQQVGTLRALKVIHDDVKGNPSIAQRFKREAVLLGRLRHPHIVNVIDYGHLDNGWPFLMLELVEGGDLHRFLATRPPLPLLVVLDVLLQLARVLQYAHAQGVIHRDLKPGNMLLRGDDPRQVKVIDFGLAKLVSAEMLTRLTADRQIMGSPEYMAPEQAMAMPDITGAADVYALAGIAYAMLSGRPVFDDAAPLALVYKHAREDPERLSQRVQLPGRLDDLLYRCLAKTAATRPSAAAVAAELESLLVAHGGQAPHEFSVPAPADAPWRPEEPVAGGDSRGTGATIHAGSFHARSTADAAPGHDSQRIRVSKSMAREQDVVAAADVIFGPLPTGNCRAVREAMQRQMLAVIAELAEALDPIDPGVAVRRAGVGDTERHVADMELDAALLDSELAAAADSEVRIGLEGRRAAIAERVQGLRRRLDSELRELTVVVDRGRVAAPSTASMMYAELDAMIERARSLDRGER